MARWIDPGGELPAGRDLDARVAEQVLGLEVYTDNLTGEDYAYRRCDVPEGLSRMHFTDLPRYSTRLEDAWEHVAMKKAIHFVRHGGVFSAVAGSAHYFPNGRGGVGEDVFRVFARDPVAHGETPAEAICRAALICYGPK